MTAGAASFKLKIQESIAHCCARPVRVNVDVDVFFYEENIRFRHIPGSACLMCRDLRIPEVKANDDVIQAVQDCLNLKPNGIRVLKAVSREKEPLEDDRTNGLEPVFLDIGLGNNAGLVVERVKGFWNWETRDAVIPNDAEELQSRLQAFHGELPARLVPSLAYDSPAHPRSLQIEITTRCNISCAYCTHQELKEKADVPMDRLLQLLDNIDFTKIDNVDFTGLGEPVLNARLPEIIRQIRSRGNPTEIRVVTNGTALTAQKSKALCDAGITAIAFSIDSLDPERFAKSRGGASLSKVLSNLESLVAYRKEKELTYLRLRIKAVLIDNPFEEAEKLLEYSARLGLEMPHFSCLDNRNDAKSQYEENWLQDDWSREQGFVFTNWASQRWLELTGLVPQGERIGGPAQDRISGFMNEMLAPPPELCRWATDAAFVSASGEMLSCCEQMIDIPRVLRGSLLDKPITELWQNDLLWNYRLPLLLGYLPKGCEGCSWAPVNGTPMPAEALG